MKKVSTYSPSLKEVIKLIRANEPIPATAKPYIIEDATTVVNAENYVKANTEKYVCARLRDGYIGKEAYSLDGALYLQTKRGKPFGTIVAIKGDNDEPHYGIYYIPEGIVDGAAETYPIVGLAEALKQAKGEVPFHKASDVPDCYKSKEPREQIEYFLKRSMCYFWPDVYSISRGSNPVEFKNYEEIHIRQALLAGLAKYDSKKSKKASAKKTKAKKAAKKD